MLFSFFSVLHHSLSTTTYSKRPLPRMDKVHLKQRTKKLMRPLTSGIETCLFVSDSVIKTVLKFIWHDLLLGSVQTGGAGGVQKTVMKSRQTKITFFVNNDWWKLGSKLSAGRKLYNDWVTQWGTGEIVYRWESGDNDTNWFQTSLSRETINCTVKSNAKYMSA